MLFCMHVFVYISPYAGTRTYVCVIVYIHMHVCAYTCSMCMHTYTCCMCMYTITMHVYVYIHMLHMYVYNHTCNNMDACIRTMHTY